MVTLEDAPPVITETRFEDGSVDPVPAANSAASPFTIEMIKTTLVPALLSHVDKRVAESADVLSTGITDMVTQSYERFSAQFLAATSSVLDERLQPLLAQQIKTYDDKLKTVNEQMAFLRSLVEDILLADTTCDASTSVRRPCSSGVNDQARSIVGDLAAPPARQGACSIPCRFFHRGICSKGAACPFSHEAPVWESAPIPAPEDHEWFLRGAVAFARLQDLTQAHLNGSACTVLGFESVKDRWKAQIFGCRDIKLVERTHLVQYEPLATDICQKCSVQFSLCSVPPCGCPESAGQELPD